MDKTVQSVQKRFQLRKAAGAYWLLDMEQTGIPYRRPIQINDAAAEIWTMLSDGKSKEEATAEIAGKYEVPTESVRQDMDDFIEQLKQQGVML